MCVSVFGCSDHFPHVPLPPHYPLVWSARSLPRAAAGIPTAVLMNSCCSESQSPPGHCHNTRRPGAGWLLRRSPVEGSPAVNIHIQYGITHQGFLIWDPKSGAKAVGQGSAQTYWDYLIVFALIIGLAATMQGNSHQPIMASFKVFSCLLIPVEINAAEHGWCLQTSGLETLIFQLE